MKGDRTIVDAGRRTGDRGLQIVAVLAVLLVLGAGAIWLALVNDERLQTYGPSMRPTLTGRGPVEVDKSAYAAREPRRGEIVVLQAPAGVQTGACATRRQDSPCDKPLAGYSLERVLKRVVAVPGDSVAFAGDGRLILDGRRTVEPYARRCRGGCALPRPITVPDGHFFVTGDNRPVSSDSRDWGPVPLRSIDGRVIPPEKEIQDE